MKLNVFEEMDLENFFYTSRFLCLPFLLLNFTVQPSRPKHFGRLYVWVGRPGREGPIKT